MKLRITYLLILQMCICFKYAYSQSGEITESIYKSEKGIHFNNLILKGDFLSNDNLEIKLEGEGGSIIGGFYDSLKVKRKELIESNLDKERKTVTLMGVIPTFSKNDVVKYIHVRIRRINYISGEENIIYENRFDGKVLKVKK